MTLNQPWATETFDRIELARCVVTRSVERKATMSEQKRTINLLNGIVDQMKYASQVVDLVQKIVINERFSIFCDCLLDIFRRTTFDVRYETSKSGVEISRVVISSNTMDEFNSLCRLMMTKKMLRVFDSETKGSKSITRPKVVRRKKKSRKVASK